MPALLKSKLVWALAIVLALVGLYALLGFYVAPRIVRSQAIDFVRENYGRELEIGEVRVHPFKLQLEVHDVELPDADGSPMLGFKRAFVDLQIESLWRRAFVLREVIFDEPTVRAVVRPGGEMNLADLALPEDPNEPDEPISPIWISQLDVNSGAVDYADLARARPYRKELNPLTFTLRDFRTTPKGGAFRLTATTESGEKLDWQGTMALSPVVTANGAFALNNLKAKGISEFLGGSIPFDMTQGTIDLAGRCHLALGEVTSFTVGLPRIDVTGLRLQSRDANPVTVDLPASVVSRIVVRLEPQQVSIGEVRVMRLSAEAALEPDGSISLLRLMEPLGAAATAPSANTPPEPSVSATTARVDKPAGPVATATAEVDWSVDIEAVRIEDATLNFEDRKLAPVTAFELAPLDVTLAPVSADLSRPIPLKLSTDLDDSAKLQAIGTIVFKPFSVDVDSDVADVEIQKLQGYVAAGMDLQIRRGTLQSKGHFRYFPPEAEGPELQFKGDISIDRLKTIDNALEQDFFNCERIDVAKLDFALGPDAVAIQRVTLRKPFARIIVASNQVLNISAVLDPVGTAQALKEREAAQAAAEQAPKPKKEKKPRGKQKPAAPPKLAPESDVAETMPIRIGEVRIQRGTIDFADFFVKPNFAAQIFAVDGRITGVSSNTKSRAKLDFTGKVDEFSPVKISGEMRPFAFDRYTDISMTFENISLPVFNPYSGRFAGYTIAKGKLTTELDYHIENRALDAKHHIRIDQLEWGEKTDSKDAATLPVRFATSLLKDSEGVINLDLPVTGTLDDPKFRIGPIVWQIIKNLLTKVVTAPFKFLGSLFKGAEDAQYVDFAPGDAKLSDSSTSALAALGKGLAGKPDIKIEIPIVPMPEVDRTALETTAYQRTVDEATRAVTGAAPDAAVTPYESLTVEQKTEVMTEIIERRTGAPPQIPPPPPPPEGTKRKERKALAQAAALDYLESESRQHVTVDEAQLVQLAEERARGIQHALLTGTGLEPQRVFMAKRDKATMNDGRIRLELELK